MGSYLQTWNFLEEQASLMETLEFPCGTSFSNSDMDSYLRKWKSGKNGDLRSYPRTSIKGIEFSQMIG